MSNDAERRLEREVEVEAPVEAVWRALTDAQELARWFPREAAVTPGQGGKVWISWGGAWEGEWRIALWEPMSRLRLVETRAACDASGAPIDDPDTPPVELTLDYILEGRGGTTRLRLVQSGFGRGANWDDEVESTGLGWRYELQSLRHYLERHRGSDRSVVWAQSHPGVGVEEAWARLWSAAGVAGEGDVSGLAPGDRYRIRTAGGDELAGRVVLHLPPRMFAGTVGRLNDGLLRVSSERLGGRTWTSIWLATYGVDAASVASLQSRMDALLSGLFGKPAASLPAPAQA